MPIHRTLKNVVKNYTLSEVKVREATSNDPWGPSTALMTEIADLTFNAMALAEIMTMIWKRLSDHGKNWRHVYKSLVLLDYLLKTGSEKVALQCRDNIHSIQSLKDFQYVEDGKDHGTNVREKSKQIATLLRDEERFKNERTKALTAKERFAQNTGIGSTTRTESGGSMSHSTSDRYLYTSSSQGQGPPLNSDLEAVRPSSFGEEDLQLQLALAMSKEEHDEELKRRKGDDLKLQMAIEESRKQTTETGASGYNDLVAFDAAMTGSISSSKMPPSATWDGHLSTASASADPWSAPTVARPPPSVQVDPWGLPPPQAERAPAVAVDPWSPPPSSSSLAFGQPNRNISSPWDAPAQPPVQPHAYFSNGAHSSSTGGGGGGAIVDDEFDLLSTRFKAMPTAGATPAQTNPANFDLLGLGLGDGGGGGGGVDPWDVSSGVKSSPGHDAGKKKTVQEFLGANANLVNLNDLVTPKPPPSTVLNPFGIPNAQAHSNAGSLFAARSLDEEKSRRVPINQMQQASTAVAAAPGYYGQSGPFVNATGYPDPLLLSTGGGWPGSSYPAVAAQQPIMQPGAYPQSKNPFQ